MRAKTRGGKLGWAPSGAGTTAGPSARRSAGSDEAVPVLAGSLLGPDDEASIEPASTTQAIGGCSSRCLAVVSQPQKTGRSRWPRSKADQVDLRGVVRRTGVDGCDPDPSDEYRGARVDGSGTAPRREIVTQLLREGKEIDGRVDEVCWHRHRDEGPRALRTPWGPRLASDRAKRWLAERKARPINDGASRRSRWISSRGILGRQVLRPGGRRCVPGHPRRARSVPRPPIARCTFVHGA